MNTLICCIIKNENRYIKEWIEYHKSLGVTNIAIYDNNFIGGENPLDVIQEYVDSGYISYHNVRGISENQCQVYSNCYEEYRNDYDWIIFIDADEFLTFTQANNISEFLSYPAFEHSDMIHLNWMVYGDNDKLYYEDLPVLERFPEPLNFDTRISYDFPDNYHIKSIVRGKLKNTTLLVWHAPHTPCNSELKCTDQFGLPCYTDMSVLPYNYSVAYIRHYRYKSTEEYGEKIARGWADHIASEQDILNCLNDYFKIHNYSDEKNKIIRDTLAKYDIIVT